VAAFTYDYALPTSLFTPRTITLQNTRQSSFYDEYEMMKLAPSEGLPEVRLLLVFTLTEAIQFWGGLPNHTSWALTRNNKSAGRAGFGFGIYSVRICV
jgi:hypothetical protein